jgi:hypothetical protein
VSCHIRFIIGMEQPAESRRKERPASCQNLRFPSWLACLARIAEERLLSKNSRGASSAAYY